MPAEPHKPEQAKQVFAEEGMSQRELAARIRDLESALASTRAGMPLSLIPENGAGIATDIAETWSQYDQEQANASAAARAIAKD